MNPGWPSTRLSNEVAAIKTRKSDKQTNQSQLTKKAAGIPGGFFCIHHLPSALKE
jgi:hypothetical protein